MFDFYHPQVCVNLVYLAQLVLNHSQLKSGTLARMTLTTLI